MKDPRNVYGPNDPLPINARLQIDEVTWARFDGMHIIIETLGVDRVRLTPMAMAALFWMTDKINEDHPRQFVITLEEALRLE